jgi:hypothetical protein
VDCLQAFFRTGVTPFMSEEMQRNADRRVVMNLVADCIIETMEKVIESAGQARTEMEFINSLTEIDLRADTPESVKKAFGWRYGQVVIYVSRFYQYCLKGYQLKNYTDKRFFKAINLYIEKTGLVKAEDKKSNILGRQIVVDISSTAGKIVTTMPEEDLPF